MTKEELEKDYYADRPTEPYSVDDSPNDCANIAHYAEENLGKAFERIAELENKIADIKANCDLAIEGRNVKIMELEQQIKQMRKELQEIKTSYDNSKNKTPIKASGAEYRLFCGIENLIEKWEIKENDIDN